MFFLFNITTLQVFVTYLTCALYVHPFWFYKHQHDNRVRSKLFVACQLWWFQWPFWFVPSVPGYLREEEKHKPDPWHNPIERYHMGLHLENEVAVVKIPTIISNNPVFYMHLPAKISVMQRGKLCCCFVTRVLRRFIANSGYFHHLSVSTCMCNRPILLIINGECYLALHVHKLSRFTNSVE